MGKGKKNAAIEALDDSKARECSGKSIISMIKDLLDEDIDELMDDEVWEGRKKSEKDAVKNHAAGLADAIAIIENPYLPDADIVRADAMARYDDRNA